MLAHRQKLQFVGAHLLIEAESKENMVSGLWDTIPESTLTLCQSRHHPPVRDF
jgi:hypothetical protein